MKDNILVIKLSALGDFIQTLGAMRAIRNHHPHQKITLLTTKPFVDLAKKSGYFDNIEIDNRPKFFQILKWIALKNKLNTGDYNRVYDLQNNDRTGIYFKLFHPKPEWVGTTKGASHRNTSPERTIGLAFYGHAQTLALAGIKNIDIDTLDWIKSDISHFNLTKPYALIVSGSAPQHLQKRWSHYASLCEALFIKKITPVLIGTAAEKETLNYIERKCTGVINLCGKTSLEDLPSLARGAEFSVGNDTGPMHLIAPTGCKTIVLFSKNSNPKRHAPLGKDVITLQENNLSDLKTETVLNLIF